MMMKAMFKKFFKSKDRVAAVAAGPSNIVKHELEGNNKIESPSRRIKW
jgi:hypothetical protein